MIKKIGNRIKKIRLTKKYTLANMAEELQMTASAYRKIEQGITNAPTSRLLKIAGVLEVNVTGFFEDEDGAVETKEKFAYATRHDVDVAMRLLQQLMKDFEKLREELLPKKT